MYYGWVEDRIRSLAESDWRFFRELPWCLVTCIDSSPVKSTRTAAEIVERQSSCSFLGGGLAVGEGRILELAKACNLFNGFDEIWFFREQPAVAKPEKLTIIPPPYDLTAYAPSQELLDWIELSGCVLGLADGIGMNYITPTKEIAESITARQRRS